MYAYPATEQFSLECHFEQSEANTYVKLLPEPLITFSQLSEIKKAKNEVIGKVLTRGIFETKKDSIQILLFSKFTTNWSSTLTSSNSCFSSDD